MKTQFVNTKHISISNFTFDSKTNTISFFSTKTNKCWSRGFNYRVFYFINKMCNENPKQNELNSLKKYIKNGNN